MSKTTAAHVLIQLGYATYGEGETAEAARTDARQWVDAENVAALDDVPVRVSAGAVRSNHVDGDMVIVPRDVADELGDY